MVRVREPFGACFPTASVCSGPYLLPMSLKTVFQHHRIAVRDVALLIVGFFTISFVAFQFDFVGPISDERQIDVEEMLVLGALFAFGAVFLFWRQLAELEREIDRRVAAERRAHDLAHSDPLTGLANRRQFEQVLKDSVEELPAGRVHAVLMLDLNNFKDINDVHGHSAGDDVLAIVAQRFLATMREGDLLARIGGDEFAVVARELPGPSAAECIAIRMMTCLDEPIYRKGLEHRIGVGIGIALIPQDGNRYEDVLRKADVALYRAKGEERSAARFFERDMDLNAGQAPLTEIRAAS
jgi:diguanylate cyclase (GGDEF)-like protein